MEQIVKKEISTSIAEFKLPKYEDIPNVGLFLEQTAKYISEILAPLGIAITGSMISNYVKKKIITNPVKKQYGREQIAYLIFIAIAKTVLSLEDIQMLIKMQKESYESKVVYKYFCVELENVLFYVFGLKDTLEEVGISKSDERIIFRNTIITVAYKVYLDKCFLYLNDDCKHK